MPAPLAPPQTPRLAPFLAAANNLLLEMADALNSGHMKMLEPRSPANTTSTTLESFVAEIFLPACRGKASSA